MTRRPSPFRRRRSKAQAQPPEASFEVPFEPIGSASPTPAPLLSEDLQPTAVFGAAGVASSAPGNEQPDLPSNPGFRDRGLYRRRLRYLRRVRELGFRDLGGLVFDQYRFSRAGEQLVRGKLVALDAVDRELRALERAVDDRRTYFDLREPGIAACPRCAGLHGSDARFCPSCGMRLSGPLAVNEVGDAPPSPSIITAASPAPGEVPVQQPVSAVETGSTPTSSEPSTPVETPEPAASEPTEAAPAAEQPTTVMDAAPAPDPGLGER